MAMSGIMTVRTAARVFISSRMSRRAPDSLAVRSIVMHWFPSAMSQERGGRRHICMRERDKEAVVVIGAGLAGLTAAATAARVRRPVVVVEAHTAGGRARTDERGGYRFNQGPHALGRGGEAWRILRDLGVPHRGHRPPLRGARVVRDGKLAWSYRQDLWIKIF